MYHLQHKHSTSRSALPYQLNTGLGNKLDKAGGTISGGDLNINGDDNGTRGLRIRRNGADHESAKFAVDDNGLIISSIQDEDTSYIKFNFIYTDTEKNGGAKAGQKSVKLYASNAEGTVLELEKIKVSEVICPTTHYAITSVSVTNTAGKLYSDAPSFYYVKNGWCFFHLWFKFTGNTGDWYPFYLPKTAISDNLYFEDGYERNGQLRIEQSGRVRISNTKTSTTASHYWGCYPIA